jgi:hypothetical protein
VTRQHPDLPLVVIDTELDDADAELHEHFERVDRRADYAPSQPERRAGVDRSLCRSEAPHRAHAAVPVPGRTTAPSSPPSPDGAEATAEQADTAAVTTPVPPGGGRREPSEYLPLFSLFADMVCLPSERERCVRCVGLGWLCVATGRPADGRCCGDGADCPSSNGCPDCHVAGECGGRGYVVPSEREQ